MAGIAEILEPEPDTRLSKGEEGGGGGEEGGEGGRKGEGRGGGKRILRTRTEPWALLKMSRNLDVEDMEDCGLLGVIGSYWGSFK